MLPKAELKAADVVSDAYRGSGESAALIVSTDAQHFSHIDDDTVAAYFLVVQRLKIPERG